MYVYTVLYMTFYEQVNLFNSSLLTEMVGITVQLFNDEAEK